jgi:L,D-transpeptidase catalytic domain
VYRFGAFVAFAAILAAFFWLSGGDDEAASERPPPPQLVAEVIAWDDYLLLVRPGEHVAVRAAPGGGLARHVADQTEFGSRESLLPTGERRGPWIEVRHTSLGNSGTGWVDLRAAPLELAPRTVRLEVDLSDRQLLVYGHDRRAQARRISVAIGAPGTPTPPGVYYVTDKLRGADYGSVYGCCILALSGRQPNLPQGWSGGDRLAIHGSPTPTWGKDVSNGCLHARESDLRYLMKVVPLGSLVTVRT